MLNSGLADHEAWTLDLSGLAEPVDLRASLGQALPRLKQRQKPERGWVDTPRIAGDILGRRKETIQLLQPSFLGVSP
jgi:hypothetical protein